MIATSSTRTHAIGRCGGKALSLALVSTAVLASLLASPHAAAQCQTWQALAEGPESRVFSLREYAGELIAGARGIAPGAPAIERWDGSSWQALGGGVGPAGSTSNRVFAMGEFNGELIAGGVFTTAGTANASNIARWNGAFWQALGSGTDSSVLALTVYNGELIAGGTFTTAGGQTVNHIARWNGSSWQPLGNGVNGWVRALTVYNGELIAGGEFTVIPDSAGGGLLANRIARWNGTFWQALGSGTDASVFALTEYNGALVAGGTFLTAGKQSANRVAGWDGSTWQPFGDGFNNHVFALTVYNNDLVAGGDFTAAESLPANRIARWDGSSWEALGVGTASTIDALGIYQSDLIVAGNFDAIGGVSADWVASYGGDSPQIIQQPQNTLVAEGEEAALTVLVENPQAGPFTYQWFKDGMPLANNANISGGTDFTLIVNAVTEADFGIYDVEITSACGSVLSEPAALGITSGPLDACLADLVSSATFQPPPDGAVDGADLAFLLGSWGTCQ